MQKTVSSAICMNWPLHRRRWDRSHRWTKSFDLERLWMMSTTTSTLIYEISCAAKRYNDANHAPSRSTLESSWSHLFQCNVVQLWRLGTNCGDLRLLRLSASRSRHRYTCYTTSATPRYTLHTSCKSQLLCSEKSVCQALQNSCISSTTSCQSHLGQKKMLSSCFISFMSEFLRIWPTFVSLSISVKYSWMAISVTCSSFLWEVFRQASCNVANLRSGTESAELATHSKCLSCASYMCVHVLFEPCLYKINLRCKILSATSRHSRHQLSEPRGFSETCRELADKVSDAGVVGTTETMPFAVSKVRIWKGLARHRIQRSHRDKRGGKLGLHCFF